MNAEVISISEYPWSWIVWSANTLAVLTIVILGACLIAKKKAWFLSPLVLGYVLLFGWRCFKASILPHEHVFPYILKMDEPLPPGMFPVLSENTHVDVLAWGVALTIVLLAATFKKKRG